MVTEYEEYKVIEVKEGGCSNLFLGSSYIPQDKLQERINEEAKKGWQVVFQVIEQKRFLLLWSREVVIITLGR